MKVTGRVSPDKPVFEYIYRYADSIAVGITSEEKMDESYSAAIACG